MRDSTPSIVFISALLACPVLARASAFESPGVGTKALAMGGAFVAVADDWSAAYWNPAGLAWMSGLGVGGSVDLLALRSFDGNSVANPSLPITQRNIEQHDPYFQLGGEPTRFNVADTTLHAALPSLAAHYTTGRWGFSLGVYAPLGYAYSWHDGTIPGYDASYTSQGYILTYNASLAYKAGDRWSIGAGVNVLDARSSLSGDKITPAYTYQEAADGHGYAVQGVFGLMVRPHPKFSFGACYKTGTDITLHGTAQVSDSLFPLTLPGSPVPITNERSKSELGLHDPSTITAGIAFFPSPALTLTLDWEGTDWRPTRVDEHFDTQGVILQNQDFNAGWRFSHRIRVGEEYRWTLRDTDTLFWRAGYLRDPSALPDSNLSLTNLVDVSRNLFSFGLGWRHKAWEPAVTFIYEDGRRIADNVLYKQVDRLLSVGLRYFFL